MGCAIDSRNRLILLFGGPSRRPSASRCPFFEGFRLLALMEQGALNVGDNLDQKKTCILIGSGRFSPFLIDVPLGTTEQYLKQDLRSVLPTSMTI